ncbi:hypothetical protein ACFSTH_02145 [Paenibacillus yanchengensis]|uniref:Extracellular solute-binding protein n=1 Tax=Paenibacillus yanchengensis TaxID=2035833 RepID=A0ABW4YQM3_9BACL
MQRRVTHKLAAIMLIMAMVFAACSSGMGSGNDTVKMEGNRTPSEDTSDVAKEEVKIRVLVPETGSRWNMFPDNAVAQEIKKKTGITVEFVESDENKFKVLLAGGDLPDIVRADPAK